MADAPARSSAPLPLPRRSRGPTPSFNIRNVAPTLAGGCRGGAFQRPRFKPPLNHPQTRVCMDTAPFRNPNYHTKNDLPDTLDYPRFARVVRGLEHVIDVLAH